MPTSTEVERKESRSSAEEKSSGARCVYSPDVDIYENEDALVLLADVPGVDEKSIEITVEKNTLTIYGKIEAQEEEKGNYNLALCEYGTGDYERIFELSDLVDRDKIKASVKNGVLKLTMPKAEAIKPKKINVIAA